MERLNFVPLIENELDRNRVKIVQDRLKSLGLASRIIREQEGSVKYYVLLVEEKDLDEAIAVLKTFGRDADSSDVDELEEEIMGKQDTPKNNGEKKQEKPLKKPTKEGKTVKEQKPAKPTTASTSKKKSTTVLSEYTAKEKTKMNVKLQKAGEKQEETEEKDLLKRYNGFAPVFHENAGSESLKKMQVYLLSVGIHSFLVWETVNGKKQCTLVVYPYDYVEATKLGLEFYGKANLEGLKQHGRNHYLTQGVADDLTSDERKIEKAVRETQIQIGRHGDSANIIEGKYNEDSNVEPVTLEELADFAGVPNIEKIVNELAGVETFRKIPENKESREMSEEEKADATTKLESLIAQITSANNELKTNPEMIDSVKNQSGKSEKKQLADEYFTLKLPTEQAPKPRIRRPHKQAEQKEVHVHQLPPKKEYRKTRTKNIHQAQSGDEMQQLI